MRTPSSKNDWQNRAYLPDGFSRRVNLDSARWTVLID
jgi:hypothetical protein